MTHANFSWPCIALTLLVFGCAVSPIPPATQPGPIAQPAPAPSKAPASSKAPVTAKAPAATAARAAPTAPKAPQVAAAPALDLKALEQRLKGTSAIGVLTKLSLKNQVDDLVQRFRAFHEGQRPPGLAELRPAFDLLLMKVLSLLQDKDPALAKDIDGSRNVLWGVLADREKLATYS